MPSQPVDAPSAESRRQLYTDLAWATAAVVVAGGLLALEPFSMTVTGRRVLPALVVGVPLGIGLSYTSVASERYRAFWADDRRRFWGLFVVAMGTQITLLAAPAWTALVMLVTFLTVIPARVLVHLFARL